MEKLIALDKKLMKLKKLDAIYATIGKVLQYLLALLLIATVFLTLAIILTDLKQKNPRLESRIITMEHINNA